MLPTRPPARLLVASLFSMAALTVSAVPAAAQDDEHELTIPRFVQPAYDAGSRSPDGNPGPNYWQNEAVHDISIDVNPPDRQISGTQTITYTNNSPYQLGILLLRLYQNVHLPTAVREEPVSNAFFTDGFTLDRLVLDGTELDPDIRLLNGGTVALITLPEPLGPDASVELEMDWHYDIALESPKDGAVDPTTYFVAYFFPRVTPFSDADFSRTAGIGWDASEYTARSGRELDNDFADFTVDVTVPKDFVVWATGELQNSDEVLQPEYADRLASSMTGDEVITVATPAELAAGEVTAQTDTVTWQWQADHVTDFAVGLSDHYVWDAGSIEADPETGRRVSVQSAYPVEATEWTTMVEDAKKAIRFGSKRLPGIPWPYPKATLFVGGANQEYPMMANDAIALPPDIAPEGYGAGEVAAHELFHQFFPFYMGSDEHRYPMLDEGWTTAIEHLFNSESLGQELADEVYAAVRSGETAPTVPGADIPAITPADALRGNVASSYNAYGKPSMAYLALHDLLGEEAFGSALREFIARWNGKHALPWDMFNSFNAATGQDLDWFWHNWFYEPNHVDLAIGAVEEGRNRHRVRVANQGGFAIPFDVLVEYADGSSDVLHETPAVWRDHPNVAVIRLEQGKEPVSVAIDTGVYAAAEPSVEDNVWPAPTAEAPTDG